MSERSTLCIQAKEPARFLRAAGKLAAQLAGRNEDVDQLVRLLGSFRLGSYTLGRFDNDSKRVSIYIEAINRAQYLDAAASLTEQLAGRNEDVHQLGLLLSSLRFGYAHSSGGSEELFNEEAFYATGERHGMDTDSIQSVPAQRERSTVEAQDAPP